MKHLYVTFKLFKTNPVRILMLMLLMQLSVRNVHGQALFSQDFSSSTALSSYVNSTSPDNGQFTLIGAYTGSHITRAIENGAFVFAKTSTSTAYGVASRTVDFAGPPQTMSYSFDITVSGVDSGSTGGLTIGVGNAFPTTTSNPSTGSYYVRTGITLTPSGFSISGQSFSGTQRVTYFLNNSGVAASYNAPDGSVQSLANDKYDIWVGSTRVASALGATTATQSMGELHTKFAPSSLAKVALDNFLITSFADAAPDTQAPTAPSGLQASASTNSAFLSWNASTDNVGVTGYKIYKDDVLLTQVTDVSYTATGLSASTSYKLSVSAVDAAGNESAKSDTTVTTSEPDVTAPTAPSGLTASTTLNSATITWNKSTDSVGVTGYKVFQDNVLLTQITDTTYTASGLNHSTAYVYSISAVDAAGNESAQASITANTKVPDTTAPSQPTALTASATQDQVTVKWSPSTDNVAVTGYKIYKNDVYLSQATDTTYTATGLTHSTSYEFTISAIDAAGNESLKDSISISTQAPAPDVTAPSVPVFVESSVTINSASFKWNQSTDSVGVTGYKVYQDNVLKSTITDTLYTASGLSHSTQYVFGVSAIDAAGNESAKLSVTLTTATPDTIAPAIPTNLVITATSSIASLKWNQATDNVAVTGYKIYKDDVFLASVTDTVYSASGLSQSTAYSFKISAVDAAGNESAKLAGSVTTPAADTNTPTVPSDLLATPAAVSAKLTWVASTDNVGVQKYKIYNGLTVVGESTTTSFTVYGLTPSTTYTFDVSALDADGNESGKATVNTTTLAHAGVQGPDSFYGMHIGGDTDIKKAVAGLSDLGVHWTRIWLDIKTWNDPTKDDHSGVIGRALALKNAGYNVCLNLNANAGVVPASYEEAKAYFEYLWKVPGLKEAVDLWEIHNELNLPIDYWKGTAEEYVNRSLKAAWDVYHVAGGEKIVGGSFTLGQDTWGGTEDIERCVAAGYLNYCDYAGTHPYATSLNELKTHFAKVKNVYGSKPIFITEWNYKWSQSLADNPTNWSNLVKQALDYYKSQGVVAVCYYRYLDGGDKQYWPGVVSSGTYGPIQPFYNMYKSQPKTPNSSVLAPSVSITMPAVADTIMSGENVRIEASASDTDGSVSKVAFYYNGNKLIGEDTDGTDGWGLTWNNVSAGRYVLSVQATDSQGATKGAYGQTVYSKSNSTGKVISINFKGTGSVLDSVDVAGIIPRKYWNGAVNSATVSDLRDENGENTGATVSNTLPGNYKSADAGTNGDYKMMSGYVAPYDGTTKEVNVSSLPPVIAEHPYDVYVYWGNQDTDNDHVQFTLNGKSFYLRDNTNRWNGVHTLSNAQTAASSASGANFVVFKNVTGDAFKIAAKAYGTFRAGVSGIQIVRSELSPQLGTVTLTSPANGTAFKQNDTVTVSAETLGFGKEVKRVSFYDSASELLAVDSVAADGWQFKINGIEAGQYTYKAIAVDSSGHAVVSAPVSITVLGEAGDVISINFTGSGPSLAANEPAGKVLVTNWNNTNYNITTDQLVDAKGVNSGASITNNIPSAYASFDSETNGDYRMMKGYIANSTAGSKDITVSNLPTNYAQKGYAVYLYWGNKDTEDDAVEFSINGKSYFIKDKTATWSGSHVQSTAETLASGAYGSNYVLFEGLTGSSFTVKVTGYGTYRTGISGMQIVRSDVATVSMATDKATYNDTEKVLLSAIPANFADSVPAKEVSFYYNTDQLIGTDRDSTNGWTYEWNNVKPGSYSITAVAKSDSATATSKPVNIRVSTDASRVISVNFAGTAGSVLAQDSIGAVPVANWNNSNANLTTDSLVTGKGELTNTLISNNLPASYQSFDTTPNGDFKMMKGYIADYTGTPKQVSIKQIPESFVKSGYSLYVYWGNKDTENDYVSYNVDTTTFFIRDNNEKWDGTHDVSLARTAAEAKTGPNYVVFENLKTDSLVLNITSFSTYRAGISGLQLVANKPKASLTLSSPAEGASYNTYDSVSLAAQSADSAAVKVAFYAGNALIGTDTLANDGWSYVWNKPAAGAYQLSAKASDVNGVETVSSAIGITVLADTIAPVITAPENLTVNNTQDTCAANLNAGTATATDNSSTVTVSGVRSDSLALNAAYPIGVTTITWTATDEAGNKSEASQTVTIKDAQAPVLTVPANVTANNDQDVCAATVDAGTASAVDNCSTVTVSGVRSDSLALNAAYPIGVTTISWTATDGAGNTAQASQTVTVKDAQAPVITAPANAEVFAAQNDLATVDPGTATAADNCSNTVPASGVRSDGLALDAAYPVGVTTITWTATDAAGNKTESLQTITVKSSAPVSIDLQQLAVYENQAAGTKVGSLSSSSLNPNGTYTYALVDGFGDNSLFEIPNSGDQISTKAALNFESKSAYQIKVRSTNQFGLSIEKEFTVTILNVNEQPTLDVIADVNSCYSSAQQTVNLSGISAGDDAGQSAILSVSSTNNALFASLSAGQVASNGMAQLQYTLAPGAHGSAVITVSVADDGGTANGGSNTIVKSFTLNVNPVPAVTITSNKGNSISKGEAAVLEASVASGASGLTYSWANAHGILNGQTSNKLTVRPAQTTTYTVTVTNASGCSSTESITINVEDNIQVVNGTNILTPNGDGVNDRFVIKNLDMYPNNTVKIFDRAGRMLFSKDNYTDQWDGTFNGQPLVQGTYYYTVDFGAGVPKIKGFITIVRD